VDTHFVCRVSEGCWFCSCEVAKTRSGEGRSCLSKWDGGWKVPRFNATKCNRSRHGEGIYVMVMSDSSVIERIMEGEGDWRMVSVSVFMS
jgi:hypothetical protein